MGIESMNDGDMKCFIVYIQQLQQKINKYGLDLASIQEGFPLFNALEIYEK